MNKPAELGMHHKTCGEKKITSTWEYCKQKQSSKQRRKKK